MSTPGDFTPAMLDRLWDMLVEEYPEDFAGDVSTPGPDASSQS